MFWSVVAGVLAMNGISLTISWALHKHALWTLYARASNSWRWSELEHRDALALLEHVDRSSMSPEALVILDTFKRHDTACLDASVYASKQFREEIPAWARDYYLRTVV